MVRLRWKNRLCTSEGAALITAAAAQTEAILQQRVTSEAEARQILRNFDAPHVPSMLNDLLYCHCAAVAVSSNSEEGSCFRGMEVAQVEVAGQKLPAPATKCREACSRDRTDARRPFASSCSPLRLHRLSFSSSISRFSAHGCPFFASSTRLPFCATLPIAFCIPKPPEFASCAAAACFFGGCTKLDEIFTRRAAAGEALETRCPLWRRLLQLNPAYLPEGAATCVWQYLLLPLLQTNERTGNVKALLLFFAHHFREYAAACCSVYAAADPSYTPPLLLSRQQSPECPLTCRATEESRSSVDAKGVAALATLCHLVIEALSARFTVTQLLLAAEYAPAAAEADAARQTTKTHEAKKTHEAEFAGSTPPASPSRAPSRAAVCVEDERAGALMESPSSSAFPAAILAKEGCPPSSTPHNPPKHSSLLQVDVVYRSHVFRVPVKGCGVELYEALLGALRRLYPKDAAAAAARGLLFAVPPQTPLEEKLLSCDELAAPENVQKLLQQQRQGQYAYSLEQQTEGGTTRGSTPEASPSAPSATEAPRRLSTEGSSRDDGEINVLRVYLLPLWTPLDPPSFFQSVAFEMQQQLLVALLQLLAFVCPHQILAKACPLPPAAKLPDARASEEDTRGRGGSRQLEQKEREAAEAASPCTTAPSSERHAKDIGQEASAAVTAKASRSADSPCLLLLEALMAVWDASVENAEQAKELAAYLLRTWSICAAGEAWGVTPDVELCRVTPSEVLGTYCLFLLLALAFHVPPATRLEAIMQSQEQLYALQQRHEGASRGCQAPLSRLEPFTTASQQTHILLHTNVFLGSLGALYDPAYFRCQSNGECLENMQPPELRFPPFKEICFRQLLVGLSGPLLARSLHPLLLYVLLYRNRCFRLYCLSTEESEAVLLSLLEAAQALPTQCTFKTLLLAKGLRRDISYPVPPAGLLLSLCLLMLTRDQSACRHFHSKVLRDVYWEGGTKLREATLGSLLILALLRLIAWQVRFARLCLAALLAHTVDCRLFGMLSPVRGETASVQRYLCLRLSLEVKAHPTAEGTSRLWLAQSATVAGSGADATASSNLREPGSDLEEKIGQSVPGSLGSSKSESPEGCACPSLQAVPPEEPIATSEAAPDLSAGELMQVELLSQLRPLLEPQLRLLLALRRLCEVTLERSGRDDDGEDDEGAANEQLIEDLAAQLCSSDGAKPVWSGSEDCVQEQLKAYGALMHAISLVGHAPRVEYRENAKSSCYFQPLIWKAIYLLMPKRSCWH
ncbi:hypothetical protein cyc_07431 [Cyclospora cayetanensis]|uniref:Dymeclin n=1 Tax=Cyclospora cayetanensis TaxID=88456 RepID=A0A1D3D503_9EIME|nr:hypothetical protein cyc_07431 [Cyclospora cayetanensis]